MHTLTHDIIISGAGPAGSTLALMLASKTGRPDRIALIGKAIGSGGRAETIAIAHDEAVATKAPDPRTLALNYGSRVMLQQLDAWPQASANIHTVHVSQRGRLGRAIIDRGDLDVPCLGSVVRYDDLLATLHGRLKESGVDLIPEASTSMTLCDGHAVFAQSQKRLRASVAVQSDGRQPQGIQRNYKQDAVLATVQASRARPNWAYERFTRQGPLALLPHPQSNEIYAVVWCCPPTHARHLQAMPAEQFDAALNQHFGDRLGTLQSVGERHVFALSMHAGPSLINPRTLAIGNAAQTLHPVAGQGLNLGLRDVAQLAITLAPWLARPDTDATPYLQQFARRRRSDRWLTAGITDILPRVFATGNPLVEHGCGLALLGLDLFPKARNMLARQLLQGLRT